MDRIELRPPLVSRVMTSLFGVLWLGACGALLTAGLRRGSIAAMVVSLVMLVVGGLVILANVTMLVVAEGDDLRARSLWHEERFARADIERFVERPAPGMPTSMGGMIAMVLRDGGRVDLRATSRGPLGRADRDDALRRLRAWLDATLTA